MVDRDNRRPLSVWENEGGSRGTLKPVLPGPQDTPDGCDAMAAADMARAARHPEGWARIRFEHSAVMWSRRAKLLQEPNQTGGGRLFR